MQMGVQRKVLFVVSWILLCGSICYCEEEETSSPPRHENFPRLFRIFSRPGDKSTEKQEGSSIIDHLGNVFKGGSIGFEVESRPLAPFHGIIDKAKDFIPSLSTSPIDKAKELFPIPFIPGLSSKPKDTDRKDTEVKPKPEDQWELEDVVPVKPENPKVPDDKDPKFESIDEDGEEDSDYYTPEPIENIIQPRIRQRRSPESKVFHVPVQFLSNAKPFEVRIK